MNRTTAAWDYAVALYSRPGVRGACLALQDRRGADVIALLALVHRAAIGGPVPAEDRLRDALAQVAPWRTLAVLRLRAVRRSIRGWRFAEGGFAEEAEAVRQSVADAELAAERVQLSVLAMALVVDAPPAGDHDASRSAAASIAMYWRLAALACDADDRAALATILAQAFPDRAGGATRAIVAAFNDRPDAWGPSSA